MNSYISIEDFQKLNIRIGTIIAAEAVVGSDTLVRLGVDVGMEEDEESGEVVEAKAAGNSSPAGEGGEKRIRTIVAGVAEYVEHADQLVNRQVPVLVNLKPKKVKGVESEGMILACGGDDGVEALLSPTVPVEPGTEVK